MPAVGIYCMEVEYCSSEKQLISKKINFYPWIRWKPHFSDRVINLQPDTELCNCGVTDSLPAMISCLTVCDLGVMCDIPAVYRHLTDISLEPENNLADDNLLSRHATASHLEAADELLSLLSDAVCVRVSCQDVKCHVCLLQQHSADDSLKTDASSCDLPVPCSRNISDSLDTIVSSNSTIDFAHGSQSDCSLDADCKTILCYTSIQRNNQMMNDSDELVSGGSSHQSYACPHQSPCSTSLDASSVQVCCCSL